MSPNPHMSPEDFRRRAHQIVDFITEYLERAEEFPVRSQVTPGEIFNRLPDTPPENPDNWDDILQSVWGAFPDSSTPNPGLLDGITHWQSPNFFAYFPANTSFPALLGDMLSSGLGVQGMIWQTSPACTEVETRVLDWLAGAIGLPPAFTHAGSNGVAAASSSRQQARPRWLRSLPHAIALVHDHPTTQTLSTNDPSSTPRLRRTHPS